jgi:bacterioferritin-associated ferredoxin
VRAEVVIPTIQDGPDVSSSVAVQSVLTQSSITNMPRLPTDILNATVVAGSNLFLAPKATLQFKCGVLDEPFVLLGRIFGPLQRPESFMIVCVPANFTATTISAVIAADDITRYVYGCIGCSAECGRCARAINTIIDEAIGACARAYCAGCQDRWIALDVTRPAVLSGPGTACEIRRNSARLLFRERPAPCAWTYADDAFEVSREMTLIAEAALRGHIGERQPVIAQLFLGQHDALLNQPVVRRHSQRATKGVGEITH